MKNMKKYGLMLLLILMAFAMVQSAQAALAPLKISAPAIVNEGEEFTLTVTFPSGGPAHWAIISIKGDSGLTNNDGIGVLKAPQVIISGFHTITARHDGYLPGMKIIYVQNIN